MYYLLPAIAFIAFWLFIIGLFNPKISLFWYNKGERTRKFSSIVYVSFWLGSGILSSIIVPKTLFQKENQSLATKAATSKEESLNQILRGHIEDLDKSYKKDDIRSNPIGLQGEILMMAAKASVIQKSDTSSNKEDKILGQKLKAKLIDFQKKELPNIRVAYAEYLRKTLWDKDIYVDINDKNSLVLTGHAFYQNANIKTMNETIQDMLRLLRFKKVFYKQYKEQDDYQYFNLEPLNYSINDLKSN
jgi:hypothetical protein